MREPITYRGYGENGQVITSVSGEDADNYLNPAQVQMKINNVSEVMNEQITMIQDALSDMLNDVNQAIIVNNTSMAPQFEELIESLEVFKSTPGQALESVYNDSVTAHDSIQDQLNENARGSVLNTNGVVRLG